MDTYLQYYIVKNSKYSNQIGRLASDKGIPEPTSPLLLGDKPSRPVSPEPEPDIGGSTQYKTCWSGCPEPLGVSVAVSNYKKLSTGTCPGSHPFSIKPSCTGLPSLLDGDSTRPLGGGGFGGRPGGKKPMALKKSTWIPIIIIGAGIGILILKPFGKTK